MLKVSKVQLDHKVIKESKVFRVLRDSKVLRDSFSVKEEGTCI